LLNVLLGQMSIIGPRPNVPAQFDEYTQAQWDKRNSLLPGITGIAQSRTRSNATWQQRYDMDIEYVDTRTFVLDIKIIIDTFKQVFFKGGY
jgi:lipopolysaccharide/colanic/teichoic acid biosynthesis glycosyltransferase